MLLWSISFLTSTIPELSPYPSERILIMLSFLYLAYCREKAERANDPNVEYVDMDDFR